MSRLYKGNYYDALSKGEVSDGLSSRLRGKLGARFGRNMRRESGAKLQSNSGKPQDNKERISKSNANNGKLKFYFAWSSDMREKLKKRDCE